MSDDRFLHVSYIDTTPEKLWTALTSAEFTRQYWGGRSIESDWKPGSTVRHVKPDGGSDWEGEVLVVDPPRVLSYTWKCTDGEPETKVTFQIEPTPTVVRLTVTHEGYAAGSKALQGVTVGWQAILSSLKTLLESGKPLDFSWWNG